MKGGGLACLGGLQKRGWIWAWGKVSIPQRSPSDSMTETPWCGRVVEKHWCSVPLTAVSQHSGDGSCRTASVCCLDVLRSSGLCLGFTQWHLSNKTDQCGVVDKFCARPPMPCSQICLIYLRGETCKFIICFFCIIQKLQNVHFLHNS